MRKIYLFLSVMLMFCSTLKAQDRTISGTVTDEKKQPLPGVSIQVKGSAVGTATDMNGKYTLKVTNLQTVVIGAKFLGYAYQEKSLKVGEANADFQLVPVNNSLDEVVVVAYGEQKKATLTGAVSTIKVKNIEDMPNLNLAQSLVGQVPGLNVSIPSDRPGQAAVITVRNPVGLSSKGQGLNAIYVIDDVVRSAADFNLLDPNEIESISVLKDGEAAIYGIDGTNGAILVRTKKGKQGAPKISFSSSFGTANAQILPKMMSGIQLANTINDYLQLQVQNPAGTPTGKTIDANGYINGDLNNKVAGWYTPDELAYISNPANNTNYLKKEFHAADVEREAINVSGGGEKATYYIGADYVNQNANFSGINSNKWGFRANVETKPAKGLTIDMNLSTDQSYSKSFWYKQNGTSENINNDIVSLSVTQPWQKWYINGNPVLLTGGSQTYNVDNINVNLFQNSDNYTKSLNYVTNMLAKATYEIPGVDGLSASVTYNNNINNGFPENYGTSFNYYVYSGLGDNHHIPGGTQVGLPITIKNGDQINISPTYTKAYQLDAGLNYRHSFGKNNITATAFYEQIESFSDGVQALNSMIDPNGLDNLNFAFGQSSANQANGLTAESGKVSYVGRVNYDYDNTYLVQLVARRDGDTNFAPNFQNADFGSISLGWVASNNKFFKNHLSFINFLKFRANIGSTGTDNSQAYTYAQQFNIKTGSSGGAVFGEGNRTYGEVEGTLPNPNLTWDHYTKTDYGVDAEFMKNRLTFTGDYFWNHGYDLLGTRVGASPLTIGGTAPSENYGVINTFGYELSLGWKDHIGTNWGYNISSFFSWSDDKVIKEDISQGLVGTFEDPTGRSDDLGTLGLKSLGIIRTQAQADQIIAERAAAAGGAQNVKILGYTPSPGMINYVDENGDGVITNDIKDQRYLSHKSSNHNNLGFNFGVNYKSIALNVTTTLSWGGTASIPSAEEGAYSGYKDYTENRPVYLVDHWTPENPNAKYPAPYWQQEYTATSDFWFVSATQLTIQNANLSYTLPNKWIRVVGLASARLYLQGTNIWQIINPYPDHYKDPSSTINGYPTLRTISIGLNAGF